MRNWKHLVALLFVVIVATVSTGCTKLKQEKDNEIKNSDITIGFSIHGLEVERWKREKIMAEEYAKEKGFNLLVADAQKSPEKQYKQCENLIYQGVNALIVIPEKDDVAGKIAKLAKENNVPIIAYDRLIKNGPVDYYITFNNYKVGVYQAKVLTDLVPKGNYVHLKGALSDFNTTFYTGGNMEVLDKFIKSGKIKIIAQENCPGWYRNEAYKFMKNVLRKTKNIDAVIAPNDDTARAMIQALDESGLAGKIPVSGQDAELESIKYILQGKQTMTVYKPIRTMNKAAFDFALDVAKGKKPQTNALMGNGYSDIPTYNIDVIPVTKENIDETLIKDGFYTKEQVYGK